MSFGAAGVFLVPEMSCLAQTNGSPALGNTQPIVLQTMTKYACEEELELIEKRKCLMHQRLECAE